MTSRELEMVKEQQGSRDQELAEIRNSFQASGTRPERFAAFLGHEFKVSFAVHKMDQLARSCGQESNLSMLAYIFTIINSY